MQPCCQKEELPLTHDIVYHCMTCITVTAYSTSADCDCMLMHAHVHRLHVHACTCTLIIILFMNLKTVIHCLHPCKHESPSNANWRVLLWWHKIIHACHWMIITALKSNVVIPILYCSCAWLLYCNINVTLHYTTLHCNMLQCSYQCTEYS